MEKKTTKKTKIPTYHLKWLEGHGFRCCADGLWLKKVGKACCVLRYIEDGLGWECSIDLMVEPTFFSNATYAAIRAGGIGFAPAHALTYAMEGVSDLSKGIQDLDVDDVLEKLGKAKEED